jgi:predicted TIM-barrel fold metal-dependent hydrolase
MARAEKLLRRNELLTGRGGISSFIARFPELDIILAHYAGSMPFHLRRLDMVQHPHFPKVRGQDLTRPPSNYAKRFYVDTAQGYHRPSFDCVRSVFGIERLLYGFDYFLLGSKLINCSALTIRS